MPSQPASAACLLVSVLRSPEGFATLSESEQSAVIRSARANLVLGRLAALVRADGAQERLNDKCSELLEAAASQAAYEARQLRWAIDRVLHALRGRPFPVVLLKGGAYLQLGLDLAEGRLVSDLDIMVPKADLAAAEGALLADGWQPMKLDEYDQHYYRAWMHELPPLRHARWGLVVDIHHNILPETSRLRPDARKLLAASIPTSDPRLRVLAPADMVLHNCVHLFQDGDLANGLRELLDLDGLLRHFGQTEGFWPALVERAGDRGLARPLYYGLCHTRGLLGTPVPPPVTEAVAAAAPPWPWRGLMRTLMERVLRPRDPERRPSQRGLAERFFYMRSHWLRMPPGLLARHLTTKARKRWAAEG